MFLNKLIEDNSNFVKCVKTMHQNNEIIPDSYVIDLDTLYDNSKMMLKKANDLNIDLFFMLKQIGRNPLIAKELINQGYLGAVVVDYKEALIMIQNDIQIANVGHLVQTPKSILEKIVLSKPLYFTVFSIEIMEQINDICKKYNIKQNVLLKVIDVENDVVYEGQHGGFEVDKIKENIKQFKNFKQLNICGVTSFPCILKDNTTNVFAPTNNVKTIHKSINILKEEGFEITQLNLPSSTAIYSLNLLKDLGATQGEPGHGLTGTTPYHNQITTGEKVCMLYLSEVSHTLRNRSYCYGGGHYRRSHVQNALVNDELVKVIAPSCESIDYYFGLDKVLKYGQTVIMSFRTQIFVTRSDVVLIKGISTKKPEIIGVYDAQGRKI